MDGPIVNWKSYEHSANELDIRFDSALLDLGSCGYM